MIAPQQALSCKGTSNLYPPIYAVALLAYIRQVYCPIRLLSHHRRFQQILCRSSPEDATGEYKLNRVAFGLWCFLFRALHTLHLLAALEKNMYLEAAKILLDFTYVDDIVFSTPSVNLAIKLRAHLFNLLQCGCFALEVI